MSNGMRIAGATRFPRAMAFGAAGDEQLAEEAGRITAVEGRALGVHVDFGPVADVNNNPRNPVINIRSFGEDPARVGAMAAAWTRGIQHGGMLARRKDGSTRRGYHRRFRRQGLRQSVHRGVEGTGRRRRRGGDDPFGFHLVNVLLHITNAVLLFHLLKHLLSPWAATARSG